MKAILSITLALLAPLAAMASPYDLGSQPTSKIETIMYGGGGVVSTRYLLAGKFSKRIIHNFEIYAVWANSSIHGQLKGIRISIISTDPKNAGEVWVDFDEIKDLESAIDQASKSQEEVFFSGRGSARIGRVKVVDNIENVFQRDSRSDSWLSMDSESFTKLLGYVRTAREALEKP